jgi:phosphotransferase system enzyme I (PtsI)
MEIKRGIAVSPGVAIGPALVLDSHHYFIPQRFIDGNRLEEELARLRIGFSEAVKEAQENERAISEKLGRQYGAIFGAHALLLGDPALAAEIEELVRKQGFAAEYAASLVIRGHVKTLEGLGRAHFAARVADLYDIERCLVRHLTGHRPDHLHHLKEPAIVLAHDLTPSETAALDPKKVLALVTEAGGRASHTAIMAGALEIPAVVGIGRFLADAPDCDLVIVDGNHGTVIFEPDPETLENYRQTQQSLEKLETQLDELRDLPAETRDGVRVTLLGNIEFPSEATHCIEKGAEGVGLYRTEFLYLGKEIEPTEADQYEAYMSVLGQLGNRSVVIRTLDLGADKFHWSAAPPDEERNPALGLRSVRFCLRNLALFKTQLRAILRASASGDVRVLFPMVSTVLELRQCKMILSEVKEDLEEEGIPFNKKMPIGTMIEVPAAAIMAAQLAKEVSFFSIGTNDLTQYTLAADRTNGNLASLYSAGDPAVLRLIEMVFKAAQEHDVEVNVCGEMSGDPVYTLWLLGMGLRQFSITPHNIPEIKKVVRSVTLAEAQQVTREAMCLETARDVNNFLREKSRRILPEVLD